MRRTLGHLRFAFLGSLPVLLLGFSLVHMTPVSAKTAAPPPKASVQAFLPTDVAGWHTDAPTQLSDQPQVADSPNANILKEYGFQQFESAVYTNSDNKLTVRAIRFQDASGAYGAFTFYRRPGSLPEEIGRSAAWDGSHALFWAGSTLVDATFDHLTGMSAAELRELANDLPQPSGSSGVAPALPGYLPRTGLVVGQSHYALGPDAYVRSGGVLPPALLDFGAGSAEAITATYATRDGDGNLTLIEYPTPQLAAARLRAIDAFLKAGPTPQTPWPAPLAESHPDSLLTRRSGPIVAIVSGALPAATARKLINQMNYEADITWNNPQGYISESAKVARLLISVFVFVGVGAGAAILLGIFLGGGRAAIRVMRGKPASAMDEQTEFIRLNLKD
jgi:Family of unknown function (DUF6599)